MTQRQSPWARAVILVVIFVALLAVSLVLYERLRGANSADEQWQLIAANMESEVAQLQEELAQQRLEQNRNEKNGVSYALTLANESTIDALSQQIRQLQAENQSLRDDLGFYENLLPVDGSGAVAIRSMQVDKSTLNADATSLRWQLLVMQPRRDARTFKGQLQIVVSGTQSGQEWHSEPAQHQESFELSHFLRIEGDVVIPADVDVLSVTARVLNGQSVLAQQTVSLPQ